VDSWLDAPAQLAVPARNTLMTLISSQFGQ